MNIHLEYDDLDSSDIPTKLDSNNVVMKVIQTFDQNGLLLSEIKYNRHDSIIRRVDKTYDRNGSVVRMDNLNGTFAEYKIKYNKNGQKLKVRSTKTVLDSNGNLVSRQYLHIYIYSKNGQLIGVKEKINHADEPELNYFYRMEYHEFLN